MRGFEFFQLGSSSAANFGEEVEQILGEIQLYKNFEGNLCFSPFDPSNVFGKAMHLHMPIGAYQGSAFGPVLFFFLDSLLASGLPLHTNEAFPLSTRMAISKDERR